MRCRQQEEIGAEGQGRQNAAILGFKPIDFEPREERKQALSYGNFG